VQAGTGMPILMDSEELRTQRMPIPNKLHHFRRLRRDTVSFRNAVVTPSEVETLCLGVELIDFGRLGQHMVGVQEDRHYKVGIICVQVAVILIIFVITSIHKYYIYYRHQ
jgi:hypothetical protein